MTWEIRQGTTVSEDGKSEGAVRRWSAGKEDCLKSMMVHINVPTFFFHLYTEWILFSVPIPRQCTDVHHQ